MSSDRPPPLPKFDSPPVIETALGIEFAPLGKWKQRDFAEYWSGIRNEFPNLELHPPLASQIEAFEQRPPIVAARLQFLPVELRWWLISDDGSRLIQLQKDRFVYNWRKGASSAQYPHYDESIKPAFKDECNRFARFLEERQLGRLEIVQCEISYINHLEKGKGWQSAADLQNVFRFWTGGPSGGFLPCPEDATFEVRYRLPQNSGRLRINVQPAIRNSDGAEILEVSLTARGKPQTTDLSAAITWLDLGRQWVVRGFADFTTDKMHGIWGRIQ